MSQNNTLVLECCHQIIKCKRIQADGRKVIGEYCIKCGGKWRAKKYNANEWNNLPWHNPAIEEQWLQQLKQHQIYLDLEQQKEKDKKNKEWWAWYNSYLKTPEWHRKRDLVLWRAKWRCEAMIACDGAQAQEVHHTTYAHVGKEPTWELRGVCRECHAEITRMDRERSNV